MYVVVRKVRAAEARGDRVAAIFGEGGVRETLYRRLPGFIRFELLKAVGEEEVFVLLEYWRSERELREAEESRRHEREMLDRITEEVIESEVVIGSFETRRDES